MVVVPQRVVAAGYDRIGAGYRDWSASSRVRLEQVRTLVAGIPPGGCVLDLGCGPGLVASTLLAAGHRVIGVDISPVQVRLARQAAPGAAFAVADITRFGLRPGCLDAVISCYVLGHLPPAAHAPLLASIAGWLRPGGVLLLNAPLRPGEAVETDWLGVPMYFAGIGPAATEAAVTAAGLHLDHAQTLSEDEGGGNTVAFHWSRFDQIAAGSAVASVTSDSAVRPARAGGCGRAGTVADCVGGAGGVPGRSPGGGADGRPSGGCAMSRYRRALCGVAGAALLAAWGLGPVTPASASPTVPRWPQSQYGVTYLGASTFITGLNEAGQVLGYRNVFGDPLTRAFLWSGGRSTDLGTLGGASNHPAGLNDRGDAVGYAELPSGGVHAYLWRAGVLTDLGTLGGERSLAWAVNNRGEVVGTSQVASGAFHPFRWRDGVMTDLGTLDGLEGTATGINDQGEIIGQAGNRAFRWRAGVLSELRGPHGGPVRVTNINEHGTVLGIETIGDYAAAWYLWTRAGLVDPGLDVFSGGPALNDADQILGTDWTNGSRAMIWQHGTRTLLPLPPGADQSSAQAINNRGQVAGFAWGPGRANQAVLWDHGRASWLPQGSCTGTEARLLSDSGYLAGTAWRPGDEQGTAVWQPTGGPGRSLPPRPQPDRHQQPQPHTG